MVPPVPAPDAYWVLMRMNDHRRWHLPMRVDALRRIFRSALWCVRMMPKREQRMLVIHILRNLHFDLKTLILGQANMLRLTLIHPGYIWLHRLPETYWESEDTFTLSELWE
jgi:hypothetical protein|eukprot:3742149-Prymnesium_polylepis.1